MTCQQCKYEWCWVCLRAWKGHNDFFNCDKQEKEVEKGKRKSKRKKMEEQREKKQMAMKRYLGYNEKYEFHEAAKKAEIELRTNATAKIKLLQDNYTKPEVQFIENAVNELLECRIVLKYTYVFAYYLFADAADPASAPPSPSASSASSSPALSSSSLSYSPHQHNHSHPHTPDLARAVAHHSAKGVAKELFELLQEDLTKTTDKLLEVIENALRRPDLEVGSMKLDAINHANLARKKRENLLNAVARDPLFAAYLD